MTKGSTRSRHDESGGVGSRLFLFFFSFFCNFFFNRRTTARDFNRVYLYFAAAQFPEISLFQRERLLPFATRPDFFFFFTPKWSVYSKIQRRETVEWRVTARPSPKQWFFKNSLPQRGLEFVKVVPSFSLSFALRSSRFLFPIRVLVSRAAESDTRFHAFTMFPSSNLCLFPRPSEVRSRPLPIYRSPSKNFGSTAFRGCSTR